MSVKIENCRNVLLHFRIRFSFQMGGFELTTLDFLKCDDFRIPPFASVRFGEAKNPGPGDSIQDQLFRLAVTNPTAIYRKTPFLQALECDLLALSETSATWEVQKREGIALRQSGYTTVWGEPVFSQTSSIYGDSLRGSSIGVSIHSKFPLRPARQPKSDWELCGRLVHGFVKLRNMEFQIIVLYGYPANLPQSKNRTDQLLKFAIEKMRYTTHPTIICGDLNHHPQTLGSWDILQQMGFVTAEQMFQAHHLVDLPPTYGSSTRNDVAIFSPQLVPWISKIEVDQQHLFAGHNPLIVTMRIPQDPIFRTTWRLPKSWIELCPQTCLIERHFAELSNDVGSTTIDCPLEAWSQKVELAVHNALQEQHQMNAEQFPATGLSKKFRGRCKQRDIVKAPKPVSVKQAWGGHYTPNTDHPSMLLKQLTTQIRRIQSLKHRVIKKERLGNLDNHDDQLAEEWDKIMRAAGFQGGFACWIGSFVELTPIPIVVPDSAYLYDLEQLLRYHTDGKVAILNKQSKEHSTFMMHLDQKLYGKKESYRKIREVGPGTLTQINTTFSTKARVVQQPGDGTIQLQLNSLDAIDLEQSFRINGKVADPIDFKPPFLEAMIHDAETRFETEVDITQERISVDPQDLAHELNQYWSQFWLSHDWNSLQDQDAWPDFTSLLEGLQTYPTIRVQTNSVQLWRSAIKKLKSTTSRGIDGWAADELKQLPDNVIQALIEAFEALITTGMPSWMMTAKTIALAKVENAVHPQKTRPITVLSLLYRLWGRCMTQQILQAWTKILPKSCTGFLPGRDPHWMIYELQVRLERSHHNLQEHPMGGLTLDIVKCFNCLPRLPCKLLLSLLGVPNHILEFWYLSIGRMFRHWQIDGQIVKGTAASTGLPEGDTWSVLAMIAVNVHLDELLKHLEIILNTYADNWSYAAEDPNVHEPAIQILLKFAKALKLTLDWNKTWIWGTDQTHQNALVQAGQLLLPEQITLSKVNNARELGYIMHYKMQAFRGTQQQRHELALARLKKLQKLAVSLQTKAHIAQSSCITKALFGTHLYATGQKFFDDLRSAICNALTGGKHNAQTYLACSCLSRYVMDPELFAIKQALIHARTYLTFASQTDKIAFCRIASTSQKRPAQTLGPAGALQFYLGKLGWKCGANGEIQVAAFVTLHICDANLADIFHWMDRAWMENVSLQVATRKNMRGFPMIDRTQTIRSFTSLSDEAQKILALDLTGGFMLKSQKQHFDDTETSTCDFCSHLDTYEHRVMDCPFTQPVRDQFPEVMETLIQQDIVHIHFPLHFEGPWKEFHDTLHFHQAPPSRVPFDLQCVEIFTDGSCKNPAEPNGRWAAFAAVRPVTPKASILSLPVLDVNDLLLHHFEVVAVGMCTGQQTIPRAELQCVLALLPLTPQITVITDSSYVIHAAELVLETTDIRSLHKFNNFDLLQKLHAHAHAGELPTFRKVKAHQTLEITDQALKWDRIGNQVADLAAKMAADTLAKDLTQALSEQAQSDKHHRSFLKQQYLCRYEMALLRARNQKTDHTKTAEDGDTQLRDILRWDPQPAVFFCTFTGYG